MLSDLFQSAPVKRKAEASAFACIPEHAYKELIRLGLLPDKVRVFIKSAGCCFYCERATTMRTTTKPDSFTMDHVIPKSQGGRNVIENYVGACYRCNLLRRTLPQDQFIAIVEAYGPHLPELGTARFNRLNAQIAKLGRGHPTKIRLPARRAIA